MKLDIPVFVQKGMFKIRKYSPEILTIIGIGGVVTGAVMACAATTKIDAVIDRHKAEVNQIHKDHYIPDNAEESEEEHLADKKDEQRELTRAYIRTGLGFAKLYGPSAAVETISIVSIVMGTRILCKRNIALAAAYATIDHSFKEYRGRVVDRFGADVDTELRLGTHEDTQIEEIVDENGKKKKIKNKVQVVDDGYLSDYARYFTYGEARAAEPNMDYNRFFLKEQQELANTMLKARGFLFLNEVYDMLGIERSIPGQIVGWVYDRNCEDHGDNYVDFGIREVCRKLSDESGDYERVLLLDFNVDGNIIDHSLSKGLITA